MLKTHFQIHSHIDSFFITNLLISYDKRLTYLQKYPVHLKEFFLKRTGLKILPNFVHLY